MWRLTLSFVLLAGCAGANAPYSASPEDPGTSQAETTAPAAGSPSRSETGSEVIAPAPDEACDGAMTFEHPPVDLDAIEYITPLGLMIDSHVTPVDHQYYQNFLEQDRWIDVYSPAAGRVTHIQHMANAISEDPSAFVDDYRLVIEHSCTISSIFIHVGELEPALAAVAPGPGEQGPVDVRVAAGELIGTYQMNVDYNVVDLDFTTDRLLVPDHYWVEPWKIHTPDPFAYFNDEIRSQMEQLSLRSTEPKGGVFAYDIEGRLVGNWFVENTDGYAGNNPERYWSTHLALAYDHLDPSLIVISIGDFGGRSRQLTVVGNTPDPADVTVESGAVLYELDEIDYWVGDQRWDRGTLATGIEARETQHPQGSALFELIDSMTLRAEYFPGIAPGDVAGFTAAAIIYER